MRSFAVPLSAIACLAFGLTGASFVAPEWTKKAGLDVWNFDEQKNRLEVAGEEARRLDAVSERFAVRSAVSQSLASDLCQERITLDEALDVLAAIARNDPDWFATLRSGLCLSAYLPQTAADRDVLTHYLRGKIESMQWDAMHLGDPSRAAVIRERLVRFDEG